MQPVFVAKKSIVKAFTPFCVLFCWLIIPALVILVRVLIINKETFEFYEDHVVHKSGLINIREDRQPFFHVNCVSFRQSLMGSLFNYGDITVDGTGRWNFELNGIKEPRALKSFLETRGAQEHHFQSVIRE